MAAVGDPRSFGAGTTEKGMDVTVGETVNNVFAIFLNANSTAVSAHAKPRCEKTQTGCATWPLSLDMGKFTAMGCGESFVISLDQQGYGSTCPPGCDCSHVFTGLDANPQFGWTNSCGEIGDPSCNGAVIEVDQCVAGEPGVPVGNRIGINGSNLVDSYTHGNVPVRIPLFSGSCNGGFNIAGFGCFVLASSAVEQYKLPVQDLQQDNREDHSRATVDCACTISCGSAGGPPEQPTDATVPVLVQSSAMIAAVVAGLLAAGWRVASATGRPMCCRPRPAPAPPPEDTGAPSGTISRCPGIPSAAASARTAASGVRSAPRCWSLPRSPRSPSSGGGSAQTPVQAAVACLYAAFLLTVAVIDLEHRRVLNVMLAPAAVVALLASLLPGPPSVLSAVVGGAAGFGLFFLIALIGRGKMGAGDVKLAGVIGLMLGFPAAITALVIGIFLGGAAAIILLITHRAGRKSTFAYAPYLALGTIVVLLAAG